MVVTDGERHVQAGRDYINNESTAKPGYAPFVYPHPLQSGVSLPAAPMNLRRVPQSCQCRRDGCVGQRTTSRASRLILAILSLTRSAAST